MKYTYEIKDVSGRVVQTIKSESPLILEENKDNSVNLSEYINKIPCHGIIDVRTTGEYKNKGFYLSFLYNWIICIDGQGLKVLVPTLKL